MALLVSDGDNLIRIRVVDLSDSRAAANVNALISINLI